MTMTHTQRRRDAARANAMPDWMQPCDQAQEHADYVAGSASDHQNAYAHSRAEFDNGMGEIRKLVAQGLHVVVMSGPAYCGSTDAVIGDRHHVVSSHLSRKVAERRAAAAGQDDAQCGDTETSWAVYPLPPRARWTPVPLDDSIEIPF